MRRIPKIAGIGFWYVMFMCLLPTVPALISPYPSATALLNDLTRNFWLLDKTAQGLKDNGELGRKVIVGPSYAFHLGDIPGFVNLGRGNTPPFEFVEIVKTNCRPQDSIYCVVTIRDIATAYHETNPGFFDRHNRLPQTVRSAYGVLFRFFYDPYPDIKPTPELFEVNPHTGFMPKIFDFQMDILQTIKWIDTGPLEDVYHLNPNTVFVIFPTFPTGNQKIDDIECRFRSKLKQKNLPFIDLNGCVPKNMFTDFCHLKAEGYDIVRKKISTL